MCIAANKVKGIRCALVTSARVAKYARRDDDANIIAFHKIYQKITQQFCNGQN